MAERNVYKNPVAGKPLISTISAGCKTPILKIKFSNLINAFYYPNSSIPRYSLTVAFDPSEHKEFIKGIQTIEKNEGVDTIIKNEMEKINGEHFNTGNVILKFQCKDKIPVYLFRENHDPLPLDLEDELNKDERVMIIYDILRYTKKNTMKIEHGISFKPSCVYYYPSKAVE